jgi:anti-sigma regulatory factor (Ser/Thr protein kinase)
MKKVFNTDLDELDNIHHYVKTNLINKNICKDLLYKVLVVSEEISSNITYYAYEQKEDNDQKTIEVELKVIDSYTVCLTFTDYGTAFNPIEYEHSDKDRKRGDKIGGLGIMLVKNLSHKIIYNRVNNKNIFTVFL